MWSSSISKILLTPILVRARFACSCLEKESINPLI